MEAKKFYNIWQNCCKVRGVKIELNESENIVLVDGVEMSTVQEISDYLNPKPILQKYRDKI